MQPSIRRVLSGIQPTGVPHLGNYLGALVNWVNLQPGVASRGAAHDQVLYSIVDLHAMTVPYDATQLRHNSRMMAASLLACGVNPDKSVIFRQAEVREHTELAWILGCNTPIGWLRRMTQFKQKGKQQDKAGLGLLSYPVLMTADILLYRAATVPVGDDQTQHLELARNIAMSFNSSYGDCFVVPNAMFREGAETRVMSLRNAANKMSKSDKSPMTRIDLTDDADTVVSKFRKAKTDGIPGITHDPEGRPEVANLLTIYAATAGCSIEQVVAQHEASSTSEFKAALADVVIQHICPIGQRILELADNVQYVDEVLAAGRDTARTVASETMKDVREAVGIV